MSKFRLYIGLERNGKWYNYGEVHPLKGGSLSILDTGDKTGTGRITKLIRGALDTVYTESGEVYELKNEDYLDIYSEDAWKIGYETIKVQTGQEYPIIPEYFLCSVCSRPNSERYTEVNESWQELFDKGYINEYYADSPDCEFKIELPNPVIVEPNRNVVGGEFNELIMKPPTLRQVSEIHKNPIAVENEANMVYSTWDTMIVKVPGLSEKDLNILKRIPESFFTKKYIVDQDNFDAISEAITQNSYGYEASGRRKYCKYCGASLFKDAQGKEIGYLDQTNFFSPLLPKTYIRKGA
jgi:hypothetical protein